MTIEALAAGAGVVSPAGRAITGRCRHRAMPSSPLLVTAPDRLSKPHPAEERAGVAVRSRVARRMRKPRERAAETAAVPPPTPFRAPMAALRHRWTRALLPRATALACAAVLAGCQARPHVV